MRLPRGIVDVPSSRSPLSLCVKSSVGKLPMPQRHHLSRMLPISLSTGLHLERSPFSFKGATVTMYPPLHQTEGGLYSWLGETCLISINSLKPAINSTNKQ